MNRLNLTTRFRQGQFESDARLLVIDDYTVTGAALGEQVRDLIDRRPLTKNIFVAAPFLRGTELEQTALEGLAVLRFRSQESESGPQFWLVDLRQSGSKLALQIQAISLLHDKPVATGNWVDLPISLIEGWLFDLFDSNHALVNAPPGVHFSKSSGKHSSKFLRVSSALLSTAACGVLAMANLARVRNLTPRRIFVDTAPLLSVAYAMQHVAARRGYWDAMPPAQSFSSYGGVEGLPQLGTGDLVLVSASTSGGLAEKLLARGCREDMLVTLFYLASTGSGPSKGGISCDMTVVPDATYGYPRIDSYAAGACPLCDGGDVLAELEGDQFLIDRRAVKLLRLTAATQLESSRLLFDTISRTTAIRVRVNEGIQRLTRVALAGPALIAANSQFAGNLARLLARFTPNPLDLLVCVDIDETTVRDFFATNSLSAVLAGARFLTPSEIDTLPEQDIPRNALVLFSVLEDHSQARTINAALRGKCRGGNVSYVAGLSVAFSARNAEDLRIFLSYGERGKDTFTYRNVASLLLPYIGSDVSAWSKERAFLHRMQESGPLPTELQDRMQWLQSSSVESDGLFLAGLNGNQLGIKPDFVFLSTTQDSGNVTQAAVYAVVCNVLACTRAGQGNVTEPPPRGTPTWRHTSLYQVLLCPSNFRDFNDPILRAALLRAADEQELNYVLDDLASAEMLDLLLAELGSWSAGSADALPEFLLAMSTGRLRLAHGHFMRLQRALADARLPPYILALASGVTTNSGL